MGLEKKRVLMVQACDDICGAEIEHLVSIAKLFGMEHCRFKLKTLENFRKKHCSNGPYDYLYLAAHADPQQFGTADGKKSFRWTDFATMLCEANCLRPGSILLLACCRGGLRAVSDSLFQYCAQIDYVCGPRWTVIPEDIAAGFHVFMYNMEIRREQPSTAARRASKATGYDFFCYDRVESEDRFTSIDENPDADSAS